MARNEWTPPAAVEDDRARYVVYADGSVMRDPDITWDVEAYRRQRQGYQCPWCFQLLTTAFDRTACEDWCCGGKGRTVDEWQAYMDSEFEGERVFGLREPAPAEPTKATKSGIWVPRDI